MRRRMVSSLTKIKSRKTAARDMSCMFGQSLSFLSRAIFFLLGHRDDRRNVVSVPSNEVFENNNG